LVHKLDPVAFDILDCRFVVPVTGHARPTQDHNTLSLKPNDHLIHGLARANVKRDVRIAECGRF